jgi:stress response protein YsnF
MTQAFGKMPPAGAGKDLSGTDLARTDLAGKDLAGKDDGTKAARPPDVDTADGERAVATSVMVMPVVAEFATIDRRVVDTGKGVRVVKTVSEHEQIADEPLALDEVRVERTEVNRWLRDGESPAVRQEGDVTVVPVLEEVLVTSKRLLLKEEIRITRVRREVHQPQRVVLRTEQVSVENFDERKDSTGPAAQSE